MLIRLFCVCCCVFNILINIDRYMEWEQRSLLYFFFCGVNHRKINWKEASNYESLFYAWGRCWAINLLYEVYIIMRVDIPQDRKWFFVVRLTDFSFLNKWPCPWLYVCMLYIPNFKYNSLVHCYRIQVRYRNMVLKNIISKIINNCYLWALVKMC